MAKQSPLATVSPVAIPGEDPELAASRQKYIDAQQAMLNALQARNEFIDPRNLAMARAFLQPTKSGRFGESLGNVMEAYGTADEAERKRNFELAQMKAEMAAREVAGRQEAQKQSLMGSLYKQASPDEEFLLDPVNAQKLAALTGDPKYLQDLNVQQRQQRMKRLGQNMFKEVTIPGDEGGPGRTEVKFNPNAALELVRQSENPMEALGKYVGMFRQLREAGMFPDLKNDESTPFDAMIMMADSVGDQGPAIKQQAQRLAKQYRSGLIDEAKANSLAQQMLQSGSSIIERQASREQANAWRQVTTAISQGHLQLAGANLALAQQQAADRADQRRKENEGKLTDEQKYALKTYVGPIVQQGQQAAMALEQLKQLRQAVNDAPSGLPRGLAASSVGKLFGTKENEALRSITALSKGLIPLIPRLPGSASNLDAQNLEKSIGELQDITLTNEQRKNLISTIEERFKRGVERANRVEAYWDTNKKYDPKILAGEPSDGGKPTPLPQALPTPSASDIEYGKQPAYREAFKRKFGKYPEAF